MDKTTQGKKTDDRTTERKGVKKNLHLSSRWNLDKNTSPVFVHTPEMSSKYLGQDPRLAARNKRIPGCFNRSLASVMRNHGHVSTVRRASTRRCDRGPILHQVPGNTTMPTAPGGPKVTACLHTDGAALRQQRCRTC